LLEHFPASSNGTMYELGDARIIGTQERFLTDGVLRGRPA
jgi:hypothetical protein